MSKLILYGVGTSPPVRACRLALQELGLPYEYKLVDLLAGANAAANYKRKNPQQTVPTLEDEGKYLWDSHAINAYLVRKYAPTDELYPKDYYQRAVVDQRLHFDSGVLFQGCIRSLVMPLFFENVTEVRREQIDASYAAYDFLEAFLAEGDYVCGATMTIADFSCIASVSSLVGFASPSIAQYPKINAWMERMKQLPYYEEANGKGAQRLSDLITATITKIV